MLVPTFNRGRYLLQCLDSLLAQTLPAHQIIVVNDGSSDRTHDIIRGYRDSIDYVTTDQLGKPGAINRGLELASGDYLWIFDDDDVAFPDAIERFVAPLRSDPQYGFSFSTFQYSCDPERKGGRESTIPDLVSRGFLIPLLEANFLGGAALFARRKCYEDAGLFDARLFRSQDYEMAIRIARRFTGTRIGGGPTFYYRQHDGARGCSSDRFPAKLRLTKWLAYDQIFFKKLYATLPLSDYLPPAAPLQGNRRRAMLQRMCVMSSKLLLAEVLADLKEIGHPGEPGLLTRQERRIIERMVTQIPYYRAGTVFVPEFFEELDRLAASRPAVRQISKVIRRTLLTGVYKKRVRNALNATKWLLDRARRLAPRKGPAASPANRSASHEFRL